MEFFNSLSFGYQVMLIGIIVFVIGVIVMLIENKTRKRSPEEIKNDYLVKNNVRTNENPAINNNSLYTNTNNTVNGEIKLNTTIPEPQQQNIVQNTNNQSGVETNSSNDTNQNSDLMNMFNK